MPVYTYNLLYLGNAADIDTDETDLLAENAADLLGTYGTSEDPLANHIVSASVNDADNDTNINTDNDHFPSSETVTIGGSAKVMDSAVVYNATITYTDGTTATITAVIMQSTDGGLYLNPELSANADTDAMEAKAIKSLTLNGILVDSTTIRADRYQTNYICFAQGTHILTDIGPRPVETLCLGDLLMTKDHGLQPLRWVGSRFLGLGAQILNPESRSVRLSQGCLAPGVPERDLILSAQHRVLLSSKIVARMFGCDEILTAAKYLAQGQVDNISTILRPMRLFHLALDRHEILFAEGAQAESLFIGSETEKILGAEVMDDLNNKLAAHSACRQPMALARKIGGRARVYSCVERHARNNKPLCSFGDFLAHSSTSALIPNSPRARLTAAL